MNGAKLFGPAHIAALVAVAVLLGGAASRCGSDEDLPKVCWTDSDGQRHCPMQSGRQDPVEK